VPDLGSYLCYSFDRGPLGRLGGKRSDGRTVQQQF